MAEKSKGNQPRWRETGDFFVNPYNFVSLEGKCEKKAINETNIPNERKQKLLTGWIEYEIETKTNLFIPNTSNDKVFPQSMDSQAETRKSMDFFSYEDLSQVEDRMGSYSEPVIPGSEIRGCIRSAFEAVTNSCLSTIDAEQVLSKRTYLPKKPGILTRIEGEWFLKPTKKVKIGIEDSKDFKEGQTVYVPGNRNKVRRNEISLSMKEGYKKGFFHKAGGFDKKRYEAIFLEPPSNSEEIKIPSKDVNRLKVVLEEYSENKENEYEHFNLEGDKALVYYSDDYKYLSPACITREVFENTLKKILVGQGGFQPCESDKEVCIACRLFGFVGEDCAFVSKVRFADARLEVNHKELKDYYHKEIVLAELSYPKISATEFYLERQNDDAALWNYDYALRSDNKKIKGYKARIKGRKFYWHSVPTEGRVTEKEIIKGDFFQVNSQSLEEHPRSVIVRPIKAGNKFNGKVFFDRATQEELAKLVWTINIGSNENDNCHKIGMGKPLGFGSVKFMVKRIECRKIEIQDGTVAHKIVPVELDTRNAVNNDSLNIIEFLKITNFGNSPENVSYPMAKEKEEEEIYLWFEANKLINPRAVKNLNFNRASINKVLPKISDKEVSLPKYACMTDLQASNRDQEHFRVAKRDQGERSSVTRAVSGTVYDCVVLEEKTAKGGWKFKIKDKNIKGCLYPNTQKPSHLEPGMEIKLIARTGGKNPQFEWKENI